MKRSIQYGTIRPTVQVELDELVEEINQEDPNTCFDFIVELDRGRADFDFTKRLYLYFKEEYERELEYFRKERT